MLSTYLEMVTKGGSIVLCGYALWLVNKLITRPNPPTKTQLWLFRSAIGMTLAVLAMAITLEMFRIKSEVHKDTFLDALAGLWFEPNDGKYALGTLNGLEWECSSVPLFNDFNGFYTVQRLWADAGESNCWIRANKCTGGLLVEFVRSGHGVDVTVPPTDNRPRLCGNNKHLAITFTNPSPVAVAVRFRIVDERGTQWAWAEEFEATQDMPKRIALKYRTEDADKKPLTIEAGSSVEFVFDLAKKWWTVFPHDGNTTLPSDASYIRVLQLVVIEVGLPNPTEQPTEKLDHVRYLSENNQQYSLIVRKIILKP